MDDFYKGVRFGLLIGLCFALYVSAQAYGIGALTTLIITAFLIVLGLPVVYFQCVFHVERAKLAAVERHKLDTPEATRARRNRIDRARHLRPVPNDDRGIS